MKGLACAVTQLLGQQNTCVRWPSLKIRTLTPTLYFSDKNHAGHTRLLLGFMRAFESTVYQVSGAGENMKEKK